MVSYYVPDMSCGHCQSSIERAIAQIDVGAIVTVDLTKRQVSVKSNASSDMLLAAISAEGYEATAI